MMQVERSCRDGKSIVLAAKCGAAILVAAMAGGCSAEFTRFDYPAFSLTGKDTTTASLAPIPSEPVNRAPDYRGSEGVPPDAPGSWGDSGYPAPQANRQGGVQRTGLSDPAPSRPGPDSRRYDPQPASPPPPAVLAPIERGESIEVRPGDTLYGLSRRHHVSVAELMDVNGLSNPTIRPGQTLQLPAAGSVQDAPPRITTTARAPVSVSPTLKAKYNGSHTVSAGDSIYGIARLHGVTAAEIQQVNGITDPHNVRVGTVLKVPGSAAEIASRPESRPAPIVVTPPAMRANQPTVINRPATQFAAREDDVSTSAIRPSSNTASAGEKLRWPVNGKIVTGFGQRSDGTHNDGINVSVPLGTAVHASESGVVAYAGSELKGYGNLVLVRHDNGWVTAYAHNEELKVKRGDKVQRGQVIARAGRTGTVDQPQLHFELRQGSKPVDPVPFLERL